VQHKRGRSGDLVFVVVSHELSGPNGLALIEEHDIVYRDAPQRGTQSTAGTPAPTTSAWKQVIKPDDVLLFRYSALTFNGHRIHYDRRYVTEIEGYPGLIVHGPLIATLLLELLHHKRPGAAVERFEFRAAKPLFDIEPFTIRGQPSEDARNVKLWAHDSEGWLAMDATATLR
jgi:3-methylfumaryl-CoA hydratase